MGEPSLLLAAQDPGHDGRKDAVKPFWAVDDPIAVGEAQQKAVDERQRDVAQIVDDGGVQIGAVRQQLHQGFRDAAW